MNEQRKTIYGERLNVLRGSDVHEQMLKYIHLSVRHFGNILNFLFVSFYNFL